MRGLLVDRVGVQRGSLRSGGRRRLIGRLAVNIGARPPVGFEVRERANTVVTGARPSVVAGVCVSIQQVVRVTARAALSWPKSDLLIWPSAGALPT